MSPPQFPIYAMVKTLRIWIMVTPPLLEIRMSSISSLLMLVLPSPNMINIGIYMYIPMIYSYIMLHIMAMALMPSVYPSWTCWWPTPSKPPQLTTSPSSRRAAKATRDATMRRTFTSCSWRPDDSDDHDPWRVRAQPISTQWPNDKLWGRFSGADSACFKHLQTISYIHTCTHTHIYIFYKILQIQYIFEKRYI
jgi:hypothetical protein